jgi:cyclopropane-fatty-acyl-phospholipid synthase
MLESGNAKGLGEAFVRGDFDIEGDLEKAVEMAIALEQRPHGWLESLTNFYRVHRLPAATRESGEPAGHETRWSGSRHSQARDRDVVSYHYDVSNDFYALWLDLGMTYSCAYFENADTPLDDAQVAKYRMLCRKLRLRPGQRLLDIGCGWGGFARHAARTCGVEVLGVTLSRKQAELAAQLAREEGLSDSVKIEQTDYRRLEYAGVFDAVASIGMAEHVGRENLGDYFATVHSLLKPGGVFLNHAIGGTKREKRFQGPSFIDAYVFPDSDIPPLPLVLEAAEKEGWEIRDVENLREHYKLTLRHWVRRLEANEAEARSLVGEQSFRVWRLYMAASAHGFDHGDLAIYQTLLAKPDADGRTHLPLTRRDWYAE